MKYYAYGLISPIIAMFVSSLFIAILSREQKEIESMSDSVYLSLWLLFTMFVLGLLILFG